MNNIPLKEAIKSTAWLECHAKDFEGELKFRLRVVAFDRTSVEEIDASCVDKVRVEGILWLMSIEVVNLCKTPKSGWKFGDIIMLSDEDGFEFERFSSALNDNHGFRKGTKSEGLYRFSGWTGNPHVQPKTKASGLITFVLPDEENNYYLAVRDGDIRLV